MSYNCHTITNKFKVTPKVVIIEGNVILCMRAKYIKFTKKVHELEYNSKRFSCVVWLSNARKNFHTSMNGIRLC